MYKKTLPSSLVICSHFSVFWRFCRAILTAHCSYTKKSEPVMEKNLHLPPRSKSLDTIPFLIGFCSVFAFIISSLVFPEGFINFMDTLQAQIVDKLGWASVFVAFLVMLFTFGIICSPIGDIRIGGPDAKPDFTFFRWFAISLCSGIGIGILFWGIGEPIYHLMKPPTNLGIEPQSHEAALFAISQSAMHWSIAQYCIYAICGVAFALMAFNEKMPLSIMSGLAPCLPARNRPLFRTIIHASCLFSICCTVISSIGALIMMVSSCLSYLTGMERTFAMNACVAVVSTVFFVTSSTTGLKKGMNFLAAQNTRMFFILMFYVFFCGPTLFILNMGTESFGYMLTNFIRHSTLVSTEFLKDRWADSWLIVYMGAFFAYGPPIGLYLARLGKGRMVCQFLLMNILAPSMFVFLWINTFGSLAIYYQWKDIVDVWTFVQTQGLESTVIGILQRFPFSGILIAFFIVVTLISFVTLVDPMSSVLATISTRGISAEEEAPKFLKVLWGGNMGGVALAVITLCGISALRGMFVFGGVLMMILTAILCWCIVKEGLILTARYKTQKKN